MAHVWSENLQSFTYILITVLSHKKYQRQAIMIFSWQLLQSRRVNWLLKDPISVPDMGIKTFDPPKKRKYSIRIRALRKKQNRPISLRKYYSFFSSGPSQKVKNRSYSSKNVKNLPWRLRNEGYKFIARIYNSPGQVSALSLQLCSFSFYSLFVSSNWLSLFYPFCHTFFLELHFILVNFQVAFVQEEEKN